MTCPICLLSPATHDCGDVRVCQPCHRLIEDEAGRRLRLMVDALLAMNRNDVMEGAA